MTWLFFDTYRTTHKSFQNRPCLRSCKMASVKILILFIVIGAVLCLSEAKRNKRKSSKGMILRQKETNPINFLRLAVMRLVFGTAVRLGFGEQISEALNGAFIPPGVDYEDYGDDFSIEGEDDYY